MSTTATDITREIVCSLDGADTPVDVAGVTDAIVSTYGLVSIESLDHDTYWGIVLDHVRT